MSLIHLPGMPPEPDRWVNVSAIEWAAPFGEGTAIRLRTGDTIKTSVGITDLMDLIEAIGEDAGEIQPGRRQ